MRHLHIMFDQIFSVTNFSLKDNFVQNFLAVSSSDKVLQRLPQVGGDQLDKELFASLNKDVDLLTSLAKLEAASTAPRLSWAVGEGENKKFFLTKRYCLFSCGIGIRMLSI